MKVRIKRRFAVWLEDAIEVPLPDDVEQDEVSEWATDNYDALFADAIRNSGTEDPDVSHVLWEDQYHADLGFPESEIVCEVVR